MLWEHIANEISENSYLTSLVGVSLSLHYSDCMGEFFVTCNLFVDEKLACVCVLNAMTGIGAEVTAEGQEMNV